MQVPEPHLCFFKIYDPNECFWSGIYFQEPCNPAQSLPCAVFRARAHTHTHTCHLCSTNPQYSSDTGMHHRAALLSQAVLQHYKEQTPVRWTLCTQRPSFHPQAQQWQHCSADCCGGNTSGIAHSYALAYGDFHLPAGRCQQPAALRSHTQSHHVPVRSQ